MCCFCIICSNYRLLILLLDTTTSTFLLFLNADRSTNHSAKLLMSSIRSTNHFVSLTSILPSMHNVLLFAVAGVLRQVQFACLPCACSRATTATSTSAAPAVSSAIEMVRLGKPQLERSSLALVVVLVDAVAHITWMH